MTKHTKLIVAIDETGDFKEQKLLGKKGKPSGIVAVLSTWGRAALENHLRNLGKENGLVYPRHFHARELLIPGERRRLHLTFSTERAKEVVSNIRAGMGDAVDAVVGVWGRLGSRRFFHEQQAYGEMLLALLHRIGQVEAQRLAAADEVWIYLASRKHEQLVGFGDVEKYHKALEVFIEQHGLQPPWPPETKVITESATKDPYLMMADFHAGLVSKNPPWSTDLSQLHQPATYDAMVGLLYQLDRVSAVLAQLARGEVVKAKKLLSMPKQARFEALRRLTTAAHGQVSDRHDQGDMDLAIRIAELLWEVAETSEALTIMGELCTIAAEVCSHRGLPASDPEVVKWRERTESLPSIAWASNVVAAKAARLENRCQTVQLDAFNVFAFDDAFLGFLDELEKYEEAAGGEEALASATDELYGKLLGTVGQACGFLRPQDAKIGVEAWGYLTRSTPHFESSSPIFKAMNLGFRLTDLWDRGCLDDAVRLMSEEQLPNARQADPYSLLHRLRIASAQKNSGLEHEPTESLVARLATFVEDPSTAGATPFDLCLKWAMFLQPDNIVMRAASNRWLDRLVRAQTALVATSLPLLVQLGQHDLAAQHLEILESYTGFRKHWETGRAEALSKSISDKTSAGFDALRGMPWNYA